MKFTPDNNICVIIKHFLKITLKLLMTEVRKYQGGDIKSGKKRQKSKACHF